MPVGRGKVLLWGGEMRAFVLSAGGNRGPLQVGALQVLLEHDIRPDMLVGSSAGAVNAAFLALNPRQDVAQQLAEIWKGVDGKRVFHGNRLTVLWRFLRGKDSLYRNDDLRHLVERSLPSKEACFADLDGIKLYVVATRLDTGEARIFGEDPSERLLDALMASTALPPFFPPWPCGQDLLVDGAIASDLPLKIALAKGATEIYALQLVDAPPQSRQIHGLLTIAEQALNHVVSRQLDADLEELSGIGGVTLHYIPLTGFYSLPLWDLSQTPEMIEEGRRQTEAYLQASQAVTRTGSPRSLGQDVKARLKTAIRRLQTNLTRNRHGLDEKTEPHSGAFGVRS